jgi:nicotinate-nucleotide adenylyltransferase
VEVEPAADIMKIGILGGTFNPVHVGHLLIAQDAMEQVGLDRVKFIPSATPPHKPPDHLVAAGHRLRMVELAIRGNPRFEVDDIEIKRGGKSYSVDTLTELKRREPRVKFYFIIGSDSLQELHLWRDIARLAKLCSFVTVARPGFKPALAGGRASRRATPIPNLKYQIIHAHASDIASRDIRARVARGQPIHYLVSDAVRDYIARHKLYR